MSRVTNRVSLGKLVRDCTFIRKSVVSLIKEGMVRTSGWKW